MKIPTWYSLKNQGNVLELLLYGVIGQDFWGEGISAKQLVEELTNQKDVETINVHINSPGGQVFEGLAIYNTLLNHPATINVYIDGMAISIASIIAMAGDHIIMAENALMMIHEATGCACGRAVDLRKTADMMDKANSNLALTYANRTQIGTDEIMAMMTAETWFTGAEALEKGFVDEVTAPIKIAACVDPRLLAMFKHPPEQVKGLAATQEKDDKLTMTVKVDASDLHAAIVELRDTIVPNARGKSLDLVKNELDILAVE